MRIPKRPMLRGQDTIESIREKSTSHRDIDPKDSEEFYVRAERIMMPFDGEEDEEEYNSVRVKNGKKDVGSVFYFEKIAFEKNIGRDVKFDSLDKFGADILQLYEADEPADPNNENLVGEGDPLLR